jgi:hypothetical protein
MADEPIHGELLEALPEVLHTADEWASHFDADNPAPVPLLEYVGREASHVCAGQQQLAQQVQMLTEIISEAVHEMRLIRLKVEEYDGSVERLELFMARHFDYPLSQVHMGDVEQLRDQIRTIAGQNLADKLAAVTLDPKIAEQVKALVEHPELHAKLDQLTGTVQDGVAGLAQTLIDAREAERVRRKQEAAELQRDAEIEAEAIRQAAAIRARELVGSQVTRADAESVSTK